MFKAKGTTSINNYILFEKQQRPIVGGIIQLDTTNSLLKLDYFMLFNHATYFTISI